MVLQYLRNVAVNYGMISQEENPYETELFEFVDKELE
jgi:hypothetical protein